MGDKGKKDKDKGRKTEDKQTGTKGKREDSEATEKNPLTESMVRCPPHSYGQHRRVP